MRLVFLWQLSHVINFLVRQVGELQQQFGSAFHSFAFASSSKIDAANAATLGALKSFRNGSSN
jgi:hypothetical protein